MMMMMVLFCGHFQQFIMSKLFVVVVVVAAVVVNDDLRYEKKIGKNIIENKWKFHHHSNLKGAKVKIIMIMIKNDEWKKIFSPPKKIEMEINVKKNSFFFLQFTVKYGTMDQWIFFSFWTNGSKKMSEQIVSQKWWWWCFFDGTWKKN